MKRTITLLIGIIMITGFAAAQTHGGLMTSDHPLYSAKMAGEEGVEGLSANESEEAEAKLKHAGKRANESKQLADEGKDVLANETADAYAQEMQEVNDLGSTVSDLAQKQKIDELVAKATQHHAAVLSKVYEKVPEQARQGIKKALDQSVKGFEMATNAMKERGQPTDGMNMSERIPSDVREQAGIDLSDVGGKPENVGGQSNGNGSNQ